MNTDYWEDQRLGRTIMKTNIDAYRKLRNTIRWMLGTLAHDKGESVEYADMPELERLMLHRLWELDAARQQGYDDLRLQAHLARSASTSWCSNCRRSISMSARTRSTAMRPSSLRRKAALQVIHKIFDRLVTWLAPMLPFTMEEAWLSRYPDALSVHLEQFRKCPANGATTRWPRSGRRSAPGAPGRHRRAGDRAQGKAHRLLAGGRALRPCHRSGAETDAGPDTAFRLEDVSAVSVTSGSCRRPQMRPFMADHRRCRFRSGVPGCVGP
jgi:isoleucyl-tRNA synthetase